MIPVSICLTTYNRAESLPRTLDSLLVQTFADFELIISDDRSTDRTPDVVATYQARDPRVRYRRNSVNLGMPGNLNAAIGEAKGRYIANLHDGDIYRPDLITKWKEALDEGSHCPFVFNAYDCLQPSGEHIVQSVFSERILPGTTIARYYFSTFSCCVWGTVMARAEAYQAAGPFDPRFGFVSDVSMWLRLACGTDVAYVPEPLITLTAREADRPYYGHPWLQMFWGMDIYAQVLRDYRDLMPEAQRYARELPSLIRKRWIRHLLLAIKWRRWDWLRDGLATCRDSPDQVLRALGRLSRKQPPAWYTQERWRPLLPCYRDEKARWATGNTAPPMN